MTALNYIDILCHLKNSISVLLHDSAVRTQHSMIALSTNLTPLKPLAFTPCLQSRMRTFTWPRWGCINSQPLFFPPRTVSTTGSVWCCLHSPALQVPSRKMTCIRRRSYADVWNCSHKHHSGMLGRATLCPSKTTHIRTARWLQTGVPCSFSQQCPVLQSASGQMYLPVREIDNIPQGEVVSEGCKAHVRVLLASVLRRCKTEQGNDVLHMSTKVVIKVLEKTWLQESHLDPNAPLGELQAHALLGSTHHPNLVSLSEAMDDGRYLYLVMPYVNGGDLFELLDARPEGKGLSEDIARHLFSQIVSGLRYLKNHNLTHGDVSVENIVLQQLRPPTPTEPSTLQCRLIDLEMARCIPVPDSPSTRSSGSDKEVYTTEYDPNSLKGNGWQSPGLHKAQDSFCSTQSEGKSFGGKPGYMAPECVDGCVFDWYAADIWSLAICLYIMLTGRPLYRHPGEDAYVLLAAGGAPGLLYHYQMSYGLRVPPLAADLICQMLRADPEERPTLEEIEAHAWLKGTKEGIPDENPKDFAGG